MSGDSGGAIRVLMLGPPTGSSGPVPRFLELLSEAFRAQGVEVATEAWGRTSDGALPNLFERLRQAWRVRSSLSAPPADVLFIHTSLEPTSVATALALLYICLGRRAATVLLFHGGDADRLGRADARMFTFATRLLLRRVAAVLVSSSEERALILGRAGHVKCQVVANPFVPAVRVERSRPAGDGTTQLLFVGRLVTEKGPLVSIDALSRIDPRRRCFLTVVGDGRAEDEVRTRAGAADVAGRVAMVGRLDTGSLAEAYANADILVFPTHYPEGFPTVLTEAMAAGLPIVTTRTRGIADHLEEGRNALFVPPRDPVAVAKAIERLLDDEDLASRMSRANRKKVLEFAPDRVAGRYLDVFRAVAAKRARMASYARTS